MGGVFSAILLFTLVLTNFRGIVRAHPNDVPTVLGTNATLLSSPPLNIDSEWVVVDVLVDEQDGRAVAEPPAAEHPGGHTDRERLRLLEREPFPVPRPGAGRREEEPRRRSRREPGRDLSQGGHACARHYQPNGRSFFSCHDALRSPSPFSLAARAQPRAAQRRASARSRSKARRARAGALGSCSRRAAWWAESMIP